MNAYQVVTDANGQPVYQGDSVSHTGKDYYVVAITFDGMLVLSEDGTRNESIIVDPAKVTTNWEGQDND